MDAPPASIVRALLPGGIDLGITEACARLRSVEGVECSPCGEPPEGARWAMRAELDGQPLRAWLEPTGAIDGILAHGRVGLLSEAEVAEAKDSDFCVVVSMRFGDQPLWDYRTQLEVLGALAPEASLVVDANACAVRPAAWLQEVRRTQTPPSPTSLYSVHCVGDDDGPLWMHTHGLRRCGAIELELLDVPHVGLRPMAQLMEAVAAMFIELGPPPPGESFCAGKDLDLYWTPWKKALAKRRVKGPGGDDDRDRLHGGESGVLWMPKKKGWRKGCCPSAYLPVLEGNPMLYVSNMETERMALLAAERLPRFIAAMAKKAGEEGWRFLVKLGYEVDEGEGREHLWFDVHGVEGDEVDATLLNAPYYVGALKEGARSRHDLHRLSDWIICSPEGSYNPDTIHRLEKRQTH